MWRIVVLNRLKNCGLQLLPGQLLTRDGFLLVLEGVVLTRAGFLLVLEGVVNKLKCLFTPGFTQDSSSGEEDGSILLEFNRNGVKLPSTLKFCHEITHVGKQGFENFWLLIVFYCLKNLCLQLSPGWWLTLAGSLLGGRRAWTIAHNVLALRLEYHTVFISHSTGLLGLLLGHTCFAALLNRIPRVLIVVILRKQS